MSAADAMAAEFDTVAEWTAEAALTLGPAHHVPAGCRGSGGPLALDWLLQRIEPSPHDVLVDVGAGVGGPAQYAREHTGCKPLVLEPQPGACRAARRLFGHDPVRADAAYLPLADDSVRTAWSLGVLDTMPEHRAYLTELARVLHPRGRLGLLVYARTGLVLDPPQGNDYPQRDHLIELCADAGLHVLDRVAVQDLGAVPADWQQRSDAVEREIARGHEHDPRWATASAQEAAVRRLLTDGVVVGELLCCRSA